MTCSLNTFGKINNLFNVLKYLNLKDKKSLHEYEEILFMSSDFDDFDDDVSLMSDFSSATTTTATATSIAVQNAKSSKQKSSNESNNNDWNNDWLDDNNFEDESEGQEENNFAIEPAAARSLSSNLDKTRDGWLDSFHVFISPIGNLALIANMHTVLVCESRLNRSNHYSLAVCSKITINENEKEFISSIICIPMANQKKNGEFLPELSCIVVGFNTGNIRFYTESGILLTTQMFHDDTVMKLKCRTHEPARYIGWINQPEELEILYANGVLVCIDGGSLYHFLKAARVIALKSNEISDVNDVVASLNLDYKKWKLDNQELITDFVSAGLTSENRFDQMHLASTIGGPNEKFESIPPVSNRYITCGNMPYICFYHAIEGLAPTVLSDVAKQVAGKVTNALMNAAKGWIGFSRTPAQPTKPKQKIELPTTLPARFGLPDYRRNGESIIISPANNLAATTDSFARVMLIDVNKGIVVRVFKGYRDAQIGWFCVEDESEEKVNKRYALYLIIYAPRRGLLEVWGCQQGIRVAAFNVGKNSKLVYPGYSMLSLNGSLMDSEHKLSHSYQLFIINENGLIKTLQIPFHLILSDKSNQRVRDTILLKKIKSLLRENAAESESLWSNLNLLLRDFKTPSIKQQALEKMINTSYLDIYKLNEILKSELNVIDKHGDNQSLESNRLVQFCRFYHALIDSYIFLNELKLNSVADDSNDGSKSTSENNNLKELSKLLKLDESDLSYYNQMKQYLRESSSKLQDDSVDLDSFTLSKYLRAFEYPTTGTLIQPQPSDNNDSDDSNDSAITIQVKSSSASRYFSLSSTMSYKERQSLGCFINGTFLNGTNNDNENQRSLANLIEKLPIKPFDLLDLAVCAWLSENYENNLGFYSIVRKLTVDLMMTSGKQQQSQAADSLNESARSQESVADQAILEGENENSISIEVFLNEYLSKFKNQCESSSSIIESLFLSWTFRSILVQLEVVDINQIDSFTMLSNRLFTMLKFYRLLKSGGQKNLFDDLFEPSWYCLRNVMAKGKGVFSELLAKHCILNEIQPKLLTIIDMDDDEEEVIDAATNSDKLSDAEKDEARIRAETQLLLENEKNKEFYDILQETRKFLPKEMESDILLVNCAWESITMFSKEKNPGGVSDIKYLEISLRHCGEVCNAILKQGVLSLIWHNHLAKRVAKLTDLIDKIAKPPKDRVLNKEIGLMENSLLKFLECIMTFLDLIMDANCSINEVPIFNYDQFWKENNENQQTMFLAQSASNDRLLGLALSTGGGAATSASTLFLSNKQLIEIAVEQKHINYHLCLFHYQLIRILYLIVKYNIKNVKPYSFFDTKGKYTLFSELHSHPLITNDVDIKILNARKFFFTKVMNSILECVEEPTSIKSKLPKEITDHLNIVFNLSKDMGVDLEFIKRYYCCILYAMDYHSEAEKILATIKERELIASQLLVVVGNKINEILSKNFDANLVSILSTNLSSWLKALGSSEYRIYNVPSKQPLMELMGSILSKLPDSFSEYKLAAELFDFIENPEFQVK